MDRWRVNSMVIYHDLLNESIVLPSILLFQQKKYLIWLIITIRIYLFSSLRIFLLIKYLLTLNGSLIIGKDIKVPMAALNNLIDN